MKKNTLWISTLLLGSTLLFSGCGSVSASRAANSQTTSSDYWATEAANEGYDEGDSFSVNETASVDDAYTADASAEADSASGSGAALASDAAKAEHEQTTRKLIRTVSLTMETEHLDTLRADLDSSITSCGGYIESSSLDTPQDSYRHRSYSVTARIPSEQLDSFLENTGSLGTITNKNISTEDITLQYVDQKAYLDSLQTEYDRVTKLLEEATDLDQILALESKLSDLRYQINSYQSQLRTYDNLVDYSTVYFYINEVAYEQTASNTIGSRITNGFRSSLYEVRDFFVDLFVFLLANLPVLLVLAAVICAAILLIRKLIRRRRQHKQTPPRVPATPSQPSQDTQAPVPPASSSTNSTATDTISDTPSDSTKNTDTKTS